MRKTRIDRGVALLLAAALLFSLGAAVRFGLRADRSEKRLQEIFDGAVLSALRQMEDMQLALSKALLSQEGGAENRYLAQVGAGAAQVQRSLALLPLSHTATQRAVKFANQVEDFTGALLRAETLREGDADRLEALIAACGESVSALRQAQSDLSRLAAGGETAFYPAAEKEPAAFDSAVAYPTLIYDGPFSDARKENETPALTGKAVSREDALAIARDFVGADRVISVSAGADMGGSIPCWGVTVTLADTVLQAAVTRQGGHILWMAPDAADFAQEKTVEDCQNSAALFLESRGYPQMQPTYFQAYQGVAVISFAAVQGETLLYPDLIKVQLRMDTAQVVGFEARNYLQNHKPRGLPKPALSRQDAQEKVSPRLQVEASRLCLIPTDGGEKLCYEFRGEYAGQTYLVYISALDGGQEELLRVMEGETGLEAV